jgi:hypothetical protein
VKDGKKKKKKMFQNLIYINRLGGARQGWENFLLLSFISHFHLAAHTFYPLN